MKKFCKIFLIIFICIFTMQLQISNTMQTNTQNIVFASNEQEVSFENLNSYILVDYNSGIVLKEKNSHEKFEIASMVKLMTSLITMEYIESGKFSLEDKVNVSEYAASQEGSEAFLEPNKSYTINELLKSVIVASANDSSVVLAEAIAGTEQNFVKMMNNKAKLLNMTNTLYANATGLPATNQYSTSYDISLLLKEICNHKLYKDYSQIWMDKLIHYDGRETELVNTNRLIRDYQGCDLGKTGFTDEAGYCLSASATKNGMRLISVVMGAKSSKDRFSISKYLLNYGFNNYENKKIIDKNSTIENEIIINGANTNTLSLKYADDFYYLSPKGENGNIKIKIDLPDKVNAPIYENDQIGICYVTLDGVIIAEIPILSDKRIDKLNFKDALQKIYNNWIF